MLKTAILAYTLKTPKDAPLHQQSLIRLAMLYAVIAVAR